MQLRNSCLGGTIFTLFVSLISAPLLFSQGSPNVTLLANINDYASVGYADVWGYAANGREYALLTTLDGLSIIDVTDTRNPVEITFIPAIASVVKDVKTYQHYAYLVSDLTGTQPSAAEEDGMLIIDLSGLPASAPVVNVYKGFSISHNLFIDEPNGMLYAQEVQDGVGVRTLTLADPVNPVELSTFAPMAHDMYARDNIVYVAESFFESIGIYDLNVPASPELITRFLIPNGEFAHSVFLTDDGTHMMTTEEADGQGVKIFDKQNLNNINLKDEYLGPSDRAHNIYINGDFCYVAHFADGLRILEITNPGEIVERGFYDTNSATSGNLGAFGVYAELPSGNILVSDKENGLFVFDFDQTQPSIVSIEAQPQNPPITIPPGGAFFNFDVTIQNHGLESTTQQYWNTVTLPIGEQIGPQLGPFTVTVPAGGTFTTTLTMEIPSRPPAGTYGFNVKVGTFPNQVIDIDSFNFTKTTSSASMADFQNWSTEGWEAVDDFTAGNQNQTPEQFALQQNYPNPFNPSTTISYQLSANGRVNVIIYDLLGRTVRQLVDAIQPAGFYTIHWDGKDEAGDIVPGGIYIYRLHAGDFTQTRKMTLLK